MPNDGIDDTKAQDLEVKEARESEQAKRRNMIELVKLSLVAVCCIVCRVKRPEVNEGCSFTSTTYNMFFLHIYVALESLRTLCHFVAFNTDQAIQQKEKSLASALGYIYLSMICITLNDASKYYGLERACIEPFASFSLILSTIILCFVARRAL